MNNYKTIDDAIYEIASQQIEKRRRNPTLSFILLAAGVLILGSVFHVEAIGRSVLLERILSFAGILLASVGLVKMIVDFTSRTKLYYKPSGSELRRYEFRFDTPYRMRVCQALTEGDLASLSGIPKGHSSDVKAVIYKTIDNAILMTQVFDSKRPLTETKIFRNGNFTLTMNMR